MRSISFPPNSFTASIAVNVLNSSPPSWLRMFILTSLITSNLEASKETFGLKKISASAWVSSRNRMKACRGAISLRKLSSHLRDAFR